MNKGYIKSGPGPVQESQNGEICSKPIVLVGETGKLETLQTLRRLGWGRMFVDKPPSPFEGEHWGFDNRAFIAWKHNTPWSAADFQRRLDRAQLCAYLPYLAVVPDIVAAGLRSLEFSLEWHAKLQRRGFWPWYLAVQDGMKVSDVAPHVAKFAGLFLGGTEKFKSSTGYRWKVLATSNGRRFHYARVGTPAKLVSAFKIGADSCDSAFPLWTEERLRIFAARWEGLDYQLNLALHEPVLKL